jgi:hypothetical protein
LARIEVQRLATQTTLLGRLDLLGNLFAFLSSRFLLQASQRYYAHRLNRWERSMIYGKFTIDAEQRNSGDWTAYIRRTNGKMIDTSPYGPKAVDTVWTDVFFNKEDAIAHAKRLIDGGGMK